VCGSSERETPRGQPVASLLLGVACVVAASVRLHGASPWPLYYWELRVW